MQITLLKEKGESRNNHPNAVVGQDFVTQQMQSHPCKTNTSQETESFALTVPWNVGKLVKISPGIIARLHHIDRRLDGIAERAVRRVKEGTSVVGLQAGLDDKWWAVSKECHCYLQNVRDLFANGKTPHDRRFGEPCEGQEIVLVKWLNIFRFLHETSQGFINLARKYCQEYSSDVHYHVGQNDQPFFFSPRIPAKKNGVPAEDP